MYSRQKYSFWKQKSKDTNFIEEVKKYPELKELIRYDENFNNKRKIIFESCMAGIIRNNPRMLYPAIEKVAGSILPDFINVFEKIKNDIRLSQKSNWLHVHFYDLFSKNPDILIEYKKYDEKPISSSKEDIENFSKWIYTNLSSKSEKSAYIQLLLIREYGNYFLRPFAHMPQFKNLNNGSGIKIIPEGIGDESVKLKMKSLWDHYISTWPVPLNHSRISTQSTFRAEETTIPGIFASKLEYDSIPISLKKLCPEISPHLPGKNLWRVTSESKFTLDSRYILDMPLIADQGGSIALILIPAMILGNLNSEELRYFNLSAISYMIGNGHHALNEFHMVWNALKIPYTKGDYSSIFPDGLISKHPELLELHEKFPDLLPIKKPSPSLMGI